jgi:maltooligosyltrehalose trehalohydrolase
VVAQGRSDSLSQCRSLALPEMQIRLVHPSDVGTFEHCKLDLSERERHAEVYALHRDLLRLRREDPAFRVQRPGALDGAVLGPQAFVLRFFGDDEDHRLLLVNLGRGLHLAAAPEPLLAPPAGKRWVVRWSSEDPRYGGCGTPPPDTEMNWRIPGETAVVLGPEDPNKGSGGKGHGSPNPIM